MSTLTATLTALWRHPADDPTAEQVAHRLDHLWQPFAEALIEALPEHLAERVPTHLGERARRTLMVTAALAAVLLTRTVIRAVIRRRRARTDDERPAPVRHGLHAALSVLTGGLWALVWIIAARRAATRRPA